MKSLYIIIAALFISACSYQKTNVDEDEILGEYDVSIEYAESDDLLISGDIMNLVDFGQVSSVGVKKINIRNKTQSSVGLNLVLSGQNYSIRLNRCGSSILAGKSCSVDVSFNARGLYDGLYSATFQITSSPELSLNLNSTVSGRPDPNTSSTATMIASLNDSFYALTQTPGLIVRKLTVTNQGPGKISPNFGLQNATNYVIKINRCSILLPGQSCSVDIAFRNSRSSAPLSNDVSQFLVSDALGHASSLTVNAVTSGPAPISFTFEDNFKNEISRIKDLNATFLTNPIDVNFTEESFTLVTGPSILVDTSLSRTSTNLIKNTASTPSVISDELFNVRFARSDEDISVSVSNQENSSLLITQISPTISSSVPNQFIVNTSNFDPAGNRSLFKVGVNGAEVNSPYIRNEITMFADIVSPNNVNQGKSRTKMYKSESGDIIIQAASGLNSSVYKFYSFKNKQRINLGRNSNISDFSPTFQKPFKVQNPNGGDSFIFRDGAANDLILVNLSQQKFSRISIGSNQRILGTMGSKVYLCQDEGSMAATDMRVLDLAESSIKLVSHAPSPLINTPTITTRERTFKVICPQSSSSGKESDSFGQVYQGEFYFIAEYLSYDPERLTKGSPQLSTRRKLFKINSSNNIVQVSDFTNNEQNQAFSSGYDMGLTAENQEQTLKVFNNKLYSIFNQMNQSNGNFIELREIINTNGVFSSARITPSLSGGNCRIILFQADHPDYLFFIGNLGENKNNLYKLDKNSNLKKISLPSSFSIEQMSSFKCGTILSTVDSKKNLYFTGLGSVVDGLGPREIYKYNPENNNLVSVASLGGQISNAIEIDESSNSIIIQNINGVHSGSGVVSNSIQLIPPYFPNVPSTSNESFITVIEMLKVD